MMWGYWGGGPGGWFGPLLMLVFWVLVIGGIVLALRSWWRQPTHRGPYGDSALDILRERYARGELSREQFEEMRRDLTSK